MRRLAPVVSFSLIILGWSLISRGMPQADIFLPSPLAVAIALRDLFVQQAFAYDIADSILRVTLGFLLAMVVGYPIGIAIGVNRAWEAWVQPVNEFARYLPVAALIPLVIIWVGIGDLQKVAIIFLGTIFQIIPMVSDTVRRVPKTLLELGHTMGFGSWRSVTKVIVPATAPEVYDHARIALGWAWSYLIVAELVAANTGIGHVIIQAQRFIRTADVMAGIVAIGIIGVVFDTAFRMPKPLVFPWTKS
jgi:NitT/TauT family transport system permease protein